MGTAEPIRPMLGVTVWARVVTWGGVRTLGNVASCGDVGAWGGVTARGGVGTLGGVDARNGDGACGGIGVRVGVLACEVIDVRGDACVFCLCSSGCSSASSSSSVKPVTTLHCFWLLSSSSMIKGPLCLGGQKFSSYRKTPLTRGAS
jgi:hypothetical protein